MAHAVGTSNQEPAFSFDEMSESSRKTMPNFLVIGAAKAGTTSFCYYLQQHPQVYFTTPKETNFFSYDDHYARGLDWYATYYADAGDHILRGEGSVFYSMHGTYPQVFDRICKALPELKIIYMVRHPLVRMESFYSQEINNGRPSVPFVQAVRERSIYVDGSLYHDNWSRYASFYGRENVHVIFFDDFCRDTAGEVERALQFLGASTGDWNFDSSVVNSRTGHREDRWAMRAIRQVPGFHQLLTRRRELFPEWMLGVLKKALRREQRVAAAWDDATLDWVLDLVADDTQTFLREMGKPADYWGDLRSSAAR